MKKTVSILASALIAVAMIFSAVSCNASASAAFKDFEILYENVPASDNNVTIGDVIKIQASFSDGSKKFIDAGGFTIEDGKSLETPIVVGPNEISVKYRDVLKTVEIYRAGQKTTDEILAVEALSSYSQGTNKRYFKFGDYAQEKATSIPESISEKPAPNGWYVGSDGKYYGKVGDELYTVSPILWCEVTNSFDYDGHNEDEAVKGTCENKASLLIAESILDAGVPYFYDCVEFYEKSNLDAAKEVDNKIRNINEKEIFTNNYEYSQLRAFLIGESYYDLDNKEVDTYKDSGLLQTAFSKAAQDKLVSVTVLNDGKNGTENCEYGYTTLCDSRLPLSSANTNDKVFALSMYELGDPAHGFGHGNEGGTVINGRRLRTPSEYAKVKGSTNAYWERTPYYKNGCSLRYVNEEGRTYVNTLASDLTVGVVPAIVVKMN